MLSDLIKFFCVLDLVGVFRTFFGVDVAFALDPDLDTEHVFLTEIVRLARRLLFLWRTWFVLASSSLRSVRSFDNAFVPFDPDCFLSVPREICNSFRES